MDIATVIGIVLSIGLVFLAILLGGSLVMFIDVQSMMIVIGGTLGATLMRNPLATVLGTTKIVMKCFFTKVDSPVSLTDSILDMSKTARKDSLLALEKIDVDNPFLAKGVSLCVDGLEPAQIRTVLEHDIVGTRGRHKRGQEVLEGAGSAAPAFGMIGTLIGLVQMLAAMDDPSSIGPAMAIALLTTLYGAMLANIVCLPLADKLKMRSQEELLNMQLCLDGVLGIVQGDHPASIEEALKAYMPPKDRKSEEKAA